MKPVASLLLFSFWCNKSSSIKKACTMDANSYGTHSEAAARAIPSPSFDKSDSGPESETSLDQSASQFHELSFEPDTEPSPDKNLEMKRLMEQTTDSQLSCSSISSITYCGGSSDTAAAEGLEVISQGSATAQARNCSCFTCCERNYKNCEFCGHQILAVTLFEYKNNAEEDTSCHCFHVPDQTTNDSPEARTFGERRVSGSSERFARAITKRSNIISNQHKVHTIPVPSQQNIRHQPQLQQSFQHPTQLQQSYQHQQINTSNFPTQHQQSFQQPNEHQQSFQCPNQHQQILHHANELPQNFQPPIQLQLSFHKPIHLQQNILYPGLLQQRFQRQRKWQQQLDLANSTTAAQHPQSFQNPAPHQQSFQNPAQHQQSFQHPAQHPQSFQYEIENNQGFQHENENNQSFQPLTEGYQQSYPSETGYPQSYQRETCYQLEIRHQHQTPHQQNFEIACSNPSALSIRNHATTTLTYSHSIPIAGTSNENHDHLYHGSQDSCIFCSPMVDILPHAVPYGYSNLTTYYTITPPSPVIHIRVHGIPGSTNLMRNFFRSPSQRGERYNGNRLSFDEATGANQMNLKPYHHHYHSRETPSSDQTSLMKHRGHCCETPCANQKVEIWLRKHRISLLNGPNSSNASSDTVSQDDGSGSCYLSSHTQGSYSNENVTFADTESAESETESSIESCVFDYRTFNESQQKRKK